MSSNLPLLISADTSNARFTANFIETNKDATDDTKDVFFFGKYISGGTKYAALYRDVTNQRLSFASSSTQPNNTITVLASLDFQCANLYAQNIQCSGQTASRIGYTNNGLVASSSIPFTSSYGQLYAGSAYLGNLISYPLANTYYTFGNRLLLGDSTAEWTIYPSSPGIGMQYSGANAVIEVEYICSLYGGASGNVRYFTLAIGSGTPAPSNPPAFNKLTSSSFGSEAWVYGWARTNVTINTNERIIPYVAIAGTLPSNTVYTVHLLARVLYYL
jgi:hypothetical protein